MHTGVGIKLFYLINKNFANPLFDFLMPIITELGTIKIMLAVAILILLVMSPKKRRAAIVLIIGLVVSSIVVYLLKHWIARPRPFMVLPDVRLLEADKMGFAFPSGHAVNVFLAATIFSAFFRRNALFFTIATLVAFSRIYLGVHFVSDVIWGAIIGMGVGYCTLALWDRFNR